MPSPIKVACVGYTNAWPLTRYLDQTRFEVMPCVPSEAARLLRAGEADVGLIPVAALLSDGDYRVVPGLAIGCDGPVASVLLVGETPLEEWEAVALDGESRTSVVLAQILLRGPLGRPDLKVYPVDAGTGPFYAQGKTGAVVIGDAAMNLPERLTHRIDLGKVWKDWTGLPFVFAVWAGRRELPPEGMAGLREAAERGLEARKFAPPAERTYLMENIRYALDDRAIMGLRRFAALGKAAGLLPKEDISLYGPPRGPAPRPDVSGLLARAADGERLSADEAHAVARHASLADLANAAHLRRLAVAPGSGVTLRPVARLADTGPDALAAALAAVDGAGEIEIAGRGFPGGLASTVELVQAIRRAGVTPTLTVASLRALGDAEGLALGVVMERLAAAGLDRIAGPVDDAFPLAAAHALGLRTTARPPAGDVDALLAVRAWQDAHGGYAAVAVGPCADAARNTATTWLRSVSLARLLVDNVDVVEADVEPFGLDVAQTALSAGASELGPVEATPVAVADAEHHLRVAGWAPVRGASSRVKAEDADARPGA